MYPHLTPPRPRRLVSALFVYCLITGVACTPVDEQPSTDSREAYRPVYVSYEEIRQVKTLTPRPLKNVGKIYVKGHYVFINELQEGIHVVDNRNPRAPQKLSFIAIPGNIDIAVKDNVLYADNTTDLVALDISNPESVSLLKRLENVFPVQQFPPHTNVVFECVNPDKGLVVRWEKTTAANLKCYR
jgi:hypothetical protein